MGETERQVRGSQRRWRRRGDEEQEGEATRGLVWEEGQGGQEGGGGLRTAVVNTS